MVILVYNIPHMNTKLVIISTVAVIAFVIMAYFMTNKPEQTVYPEMTQVRPTESTASGKLTDHTLGTGKHVMIEYSDLQCPACKSFHEYLTQEKKKDANFAKIMNEQYSFVYRHFPLTAIHKNAELAARSAEAAALQNKFYEFLDKAFATQGSWAQSDTAREYFVTIAEELGLNTQQFNTDIDSDAVSAKITADVNSGETAKIDATPTFFIDGEKIKGFGTFPEFKQIIIDSTKN